MRTLRQGWVGVGGEGRSLRGHEGAGLGNETVVSSRSALGRGVWSGGTSDDTGTGTNGVKKQMGWVIAPHCARVESPLRGLLGSAQGRDHPLTPG